MSFLGNGVGRQMIMPGQIAPGAVGYPQFDNTVTPAHIGKNRIINGATTVVQRPSIVASTGVIGYGGPDRFFAANQGSAGGQFTQSAGTITYNGVTLPAIVQTVNTAIVSTTGGNAWNGFQQSIEGYNCYDLAGQPIALSFIFLSNVTGTFSAAVRDQAGAHVYVSTFSATANVPVRVVILIPASTSLVIPNGSATSMSVNIGGINTGTFQVASINTWVSPNGFTAPGATNWGNAVNNFIAITELQLEAGTVATPFERRSIGFEFLLCQRYYQTFGQVFAGGYGAAGGPVWGEYSLPVVMRATPSVAFAQVGTSNAGAVSTDSVTTSYLRFIATLSAAGSGWSAASVTLGAEL